MNLTSDRIEIDQLFHEGVNTTEIDENIPRIQEEISYSAFFEKYLLRNHPCVISKFATDSWESRKLWASQDKPNLEYLKETFGFAEVPVANCNIREYNSQKKDTFTLEKYLEYLEELKEEENSVSKSNLYLKDWHFTRDFPDAAVYRVPKYFSSDWLNEYFSSRTDLKDDYRFVYIGPKGSWTPLHADVFTSYSWSVNVVGRKRWVLFPPGQEEHLKDQLGNLYFDVVPESTSSEDNVPFCKGVSKYYDIIQESGEVIFVPSGWHHQVWNLEDTISINHNWINGCNIKQMWFALQCCLSAVQQEVSDCRDMDGWHSHCQLMLRATHGLNFEEFFDLLQCVAVPRIRQVQGQYQVKMYGNWELGLRHALWDLKQIWATLNLLLDDATLPHLEWVQEKKPINLMEEIENVLKTAKY